MQIKCEFKIMRSRPLWHSDKKDKWNIKKEQWDRIEKLQYHSAKYREIWSNRETKVNSMIYHQSWRIQYLVVIQFLCLMHDRVPLFHNESCFVRTGISVTSLTHVYVFYFWLEVVFILMLCISNLNYGNNKESKKSKKSFLLIQTCDVDCIFQS